MALGSFMVTPFIAIFLTRKIHMDIKAVGFVVAVATFIQFAGGILGGVVSERVGYKRAMVAALALRTVGFLLLALSIHWPGIVIPAVFLVSACSALYMPANKAYVLSGADPLRRPALLALSGGAFNAGMAVGPLISALLIVSEPRLLFLSVAALFFALTAVHQFALPREPHAGVNGALPETLGSLPSSLARTWRPALFCTLTFYVYFYFQNFMGVYVSEIAGTDFFGVVMFSNFVVLAAVQFAFTRTIAEADYQALLVGGFGLFGAGLLLIAAGNLACALLGTMVMTIGQAALFLRGDLELVDQLPSQPAIAFGIQRLSAGIGGLLSGLVGGQLLSRPDGLFWVWIAAQCVVAVLLAIVFGKPSVERYAYEPAPGN